MERGAAFAPNSRCERPIHVHTRAREETDKGKHWSTRKTRSWTKEIRDETQDARGPAAAAAAGAFLYSRFLRRPILTWGATAEEAAARLPGDELLEEADGVATRAITIDVAAFGGVAVDRPDGAVAAGRRLAKRAAFFGDRQTKDLHRRGSRQLAISRQLSAGGRCRVRQRDLRPAVNTASRT
jgi:hypothetical protein